MLDIHDGAAHSAVRSSPASPVTNAMRDPRDGALYASIDHGHFGVHLHRSDDGGATWTEIAAPAIPPKPGGLVRDQPDVPVQEPWIDELTWVVEPGHPDEPGTLWCGTIPGGLFRSDDRGESWHLVESLWQLPGVRSGSAAGTTTPGSTRSASIRVGRAGSWSVCRAVAPGGPTTAARPGRSCSCGHVGRLRARGPGGRSRHAGPAPHRAVCGGPRHVVDPAPLRHLPLDRQRRQLVDDLRGRTVHVRVRRCGPSGRS